MRLHREKEGHKAPPIKVRFHDHLGEWILSAGLDSSLRAFSTVADLLNRNLGTAHYNQKKAKKIGSSKAGSKMPPIVAFSSGDFSCFTIRSFVIKLNLIRNECVEPVRDKEWDSIAAVHRNQTGVTTWSFHRSTMGEHKLKHPRFSSRDSYKKFAATVSSISDDSQSR